jgi:hypothetical protein
MGVTQDQLIAKIDDYLTHAGPYFGPWEQEEQVRREIAQAGVDTATPVIDRACIKLASFGKPETLDHFMAGPLAMRAIDLIATRTWAVLFALIASAPQGGKRVAEQLAAIMGDRDHLGRRAVAAWCCGIKGLDDSVTIGPLIKHFEYDGRMVQIACAINIVGDKNVPRDVREHARKVIDYYVKTTPLISEKYAGEAQGKLLAVYQLMLVQFLPIFLALTLYSESQPS